MFSKTAKTVAAFVALSNLCSALPQYMFGPISCSGDDWVVVDSQSQILGGEFGFESTVSAGEREYHSKQSPPFANRDDRSHLYLYPLDRHYSKSRPLHSV